MSTKSAENDGNTISRSNFKLSKRGGAFKKVKEQMSRSWEVNDGMLHVVWNNHWSMDPMLLAVPTRLLWYTNP